MTMNVTYKFFTLITAVFITMTFSFGQGKRITGRVVNEAGNPVEYASITFFGSSSGGTLTTKDGFYSTDIPKGCDTIVCSHVNYTKKIEKINGNTVLNLTLNRHLPRQSTIAVAGKHKYSLDELKRLKTDTEAADYETRVFTRVEIDASFVGGESAFQDYLARMIIYPDSATISDVKGVVQVGFVIDKDGTPKNVLLLKGINKFSDAAALQAILKMPRWIPAMQNGRYVEQYKEVSVSFDIKGID